MAFPAGSDPSNPTPSWYSTVTATPRNNVFYLSDITGGGGSGTPSVQVGPVPIKAP